jgi:hypothetical protein
MLARSAFRPRRKNSGKQHEGKRFPSHLAWLRGRPCLLEGKNGHACEGKMEAAHVDHAGGKGIGLKVADFWAVPLCTEAHRLLHDHGHVTWERSYRVDLIKAAQEYAAASPHRFQWIGQGNG